MMTAANLLRWAGLAALAGGALTVIADLLEPVIGFGEPSGLLTIQQAIDLLGWALILLGLVGLYASQAEAVGALGLLGFLVAFLGTTFVAVSVGWFLLGLAMLRARIYPRAAAIVLMVGAAVSLLPLPASRIVLAAAIAWLGLLLAGRATAAQQPPRARVELTIRF